MSKTTAGVCGCENHVLVPICPSSQSGVSEMLICHFAADELFHSFNTSHIQSQIIDAPKLVLDAGGLVVRSLCGWLNRLRPLFFVGGAGAEPRLPKVHT